MWICCLVLIEKPIGTTRRTALPQRAEAQWEGIFKIEKNTNI